MNDWQGMVKTLPRLAATMGPTFDATDKWREMTVAAALSGAAHEAMEFFRPRANQDRRPLPGFARGSYGIGNELYTYFHQLETQEPRCTTPNLVHSQSVSQRLP